MVNYLDITMCLESGTFKPYRKPNDTPLYVSAKSNHPPQVLKSLPVGINTASGDDFQLKGSLWGSRAWVRRRASCQWPPQSACRGVTGLLGVVRPGVRGVPGEKNKDFSTNRPRFSTLQPQRRVPLALIRQPHSSSKNILLMDFWYFLYIVGSQARQMELIQWFRAIALEKIAKSEVQACCAF